MSTTSQQSAIRDLVSGGEPLTIEKFAGTSDPSAADVLAMAEKLGVRMVDFKFTDVPGTWQHMTLSMSSLDEDAFSDGLGFDGSSIRGFQQISESDMLLMPDAATTVLDPFYDERTLSIICNVIDPITRETYSRDPRLRGAEGRAAPDRDRDRRHGLLRPRGRVLRLRPRRLRPAAPQGLLRGRYGGGLLESRLGLRRRAARTQRRSPPALAGGLLPHAAIGHARRPASDDGDRRSRRSASSASSTTTRWAVPARARSTCASRRCCGWPTR